MTANLIADARRFLGALAKNNTRDWFLSHKADYEASLKAPALALLDQMADPLAQLSNGPVTGKLFRANRDVRFSKDKTPYHVHLHMSWTTQDGRAWFFGISPEYVTAGVGVFSFDKAGLERWRAAVSGPAGEDLASLLKNLAPRLDAPALKRVPPPYPADHPRALLLRHKGLAVWCDDLAGDPIDNLPAAFSNLAPVQHWLAEHVTQV